VNTDTGKGMSELKSYIETIRNLQLETSQKQAIWGDGGMPVKNLVRRQILGPAQA
jgi:hypothetical protein